MKFNPRNFCLFSLIFCLVLFPALSAFANSFNLGGIRVTKEVKPMREVKREHVVTQSLDFSCGAAGLSTLLNYYLGDPITEEEIITTLLNIVPLEKVRERKGFSLLDLKRFAETKGYIVSGYKMDIEFLRQLNKPVLVPIKFKNYSHFVIVKGVIADRIFIADPAAGNMSLKIDKFQKFWNTGIGLVVESVHGTPAEYALKVDKEDFLISDYKNIRQLVDSSMIRTTVYPAEWN